MSEGTRGRRGVALVTTVLLLLVATLVGMGALHLAGWERAAAAGAVRDLRLRAAARGWAEHVLGAWMEEPDSLPRSLTGTVGELRVHGSATPLDREWVGIEGRAAIGPVGGVVREVVREERRLAWRLDPASRVARWDAAVEHGGALRAAAGSVDVGSGFEAVEGGCGVETGVLDSLRAGRPLRPARRVERADTPRALGLLGHEELARRLPSLAPGSATPAPRVAGGTCLDHPLNWGAPTAPPGAPCGRRWAAAATPGSLTLEGGEGQGVLVVEGDLVLRPGVVVRGVLLVGGSLRILDDARVTGLVSAGGEVELGPGARIVGSPCAAARALAEARELRTPVARVEGPWLSLP